MQNYYFSPTTPLDLTPPVVCNKTRNGLTKTNIANENIFYPDWYANSELITPLITHSKEKYDSHSDYNLFNGF